MQVIFDTTINQKFIALPKFRLTIHLRVQGVPISFEEWKVHDHLNFQVKGLHLGSHL